MAAGEFSAPKAATLPLLCSLSLLVVHWLAHYFYTWSLVTHTSETLCLYLVKKKKSISSGPFIVIIVISSLETPTPIHYLCLFKIIFKQIVHGPIVIGMYSLVRRDRKHSSYCRAVVRGLLGFPVGALVMAFGAIVLGAPVGIRYLTRTVYWSLLMSLFTFVPLTCTFGSSSVDWHRILAHFRPGESLDALVSLPAYGSVIGAWIGAWPMPLDWERPWQEWPICVTYGAIAGYLIGALVSMVFVLIHGPVHVKED